MEVKAVKVKEGDQIAIHFTGKLEDGTVFDSSRDREPMVFKVGEGQVIEGLENGVIGMTVGQKKTLTVIPSRAYGKVREDLITDVEKFRFPEEMQLEVGRYFEFHQFDGKLVKVKISKIDERKVSLDANHPLAGKTLLFEVELVSISE